MCRSTIFLIMILSYGCSVKNLGADLFQEGYLIKSSKLTLLKNGWRTKEIFLDHKSFDEPEGYEF